MIANPERAGAGEFLTLRGGGAGQPIRNYFVGNADIADAANITLGDALAKNSTTTILANRFQVGNSTTSASGEGSTAIGINARAADFDTVAMGSNANALAPASIAIGSGATAKATGTAKGAGFAGIAIGSKAGVDGDNSVAIGSNARANGPGALAFGSNANAAFANDAAFGTGALAVGSVEGTGPSTAFGNAAKATAPASLAIGGTAEASARNAAAFGYSANASGINALALGTVSNAKGDRSVAIGSGANASGDFSVAIGRAAIASGSSSLAIGNDGAGAEGLSANAIAIGGRAIVAADATSGIAIGRGAVVNGAFGIAQGDGATASNANDVALGARSATAAPNTGTTALYGGTAQGIAKAASGVVSVGSAGNERQIQNVAAGVISPTSTDAINGSQLNSVATGVNALGTSTAAGLGGGSTYSNATGVVSAPAYKVGGASFANVGGALGALDAVASKGWDLSANGGVVQNIAPGGKVDFINGSNTSVTRSNSQIKVDVSTTPVFTSVTTSAGTPGAAGAPGSPSTTLDGTGLTVKDLNGKAGPSVTAQGIDGGLKTITRVGKGTQDTDAANIGQLNDVGKAANNAVQYDPKKTGETQPSGATLGGLDKDGKPLVADGVTLGNVRDGNVAAGSKDAVNGGQLNTTNQNVTNLGNSIRNATLGPVQAVPNKAGQLTLVAPGATGAAPGAAQVLGNVAAGEAPNDAVNRDQLDTVSATANKGWDLSANGVNALQIAPGGTVDFVNGSNTSVTRTSNKIRVDVSKTPAFDSVSVGSGAPGTVGALGSPRTTLDGNGLTTRGADGVAGPSVTAQGIDGGLKTITRVGKGTQDTDAANIGQLNDVGKAANNAVQYDPKKTGETQPSGATLGGLDKDGKPLVADGVTLGNVKDGNVAAGSKDAVNGGQLNTTNQNVTNLGESIRNATLGPVQAVPNKAGQLTLVAPNGTGAAPGAAQVLGNVAAGKAPTDAANVGQLDALAGSAVQYDRNADGTPGKNGVTLGGRNADGTAATLPVKVGNIANGEAPNDAVNRGQLDTVSATANKGWSLSANGGGVQNIAPGGAVDFVNGSNTSVT
ncbi:hypothetical protein VLK31_09255, partial [Variovorax sp. H27-G14]